MDPNQTNPSSSTPATTGGMIPIAQLEQFLRLLQPNLDLSQTLAALATPPQVATVPVLAQTAAIPPPPGAATASTPLIIEGKTYSGLTEILEESTAEANLADDAESGPSRAMGGLPEVDAELAEVAPEVVIERAGVARDEVRTEMATVDERLDVDADRVKADMAEIEEEIREGRGPTVEVEERVEARLEAEAKRREEEIVEISETEAEERVQPVRETEAQTLNVSRRRQKLIIEEPEEEKKEGENITFRPFIEGPRQRPPVPEFVPRAVVDSQLERNRKGKQPALPPKKKFKLAASTVRIKEPRAERIATWATNSDEEETWREECISFRLCNHQWRMNLTEWSVRLGLYSVDQADQGEWLEREIGPPKNNSGFDPQEMWKAISHEGAPNSNRQYPGGYISST